MEKIKVQFILEILGKPPEHITQSLINLIDKMDKEKGIKVVEKSLHDPVPLKDSKELYTAFAEITAELDSVENYFAIIFSYFPANIEVISPKGFSLSLDKLNELGNFLVGRLHEYDNLAKTLVGENTILMNKLREVAPHLFVQKPAQPIAPPPIQEEKGKKQKSTKQGKRKKN
ncbi:MAG: hypothetical protein Q8Q31_01910 [Nanoarchaeota archaeon]|nr:hypothetical protein [Nanoarchaeota archaeon]